MSLTAARQQPTSELTSVSAFFRGRRFGRFLALVDDVIAARGHARILDLGGTANYWHTHGAALGDRPVRITIVNPLAQASGDPRLEVRPGDARALPDLADYAYDIVHSNSVLEHVGRYADMQAMAREVRRLAPRHYVQTPAAGFPVEPHFRTPFFHWLPEPVRLRLIMAMPLGAYPKADSVERAMAFLEDAVLLDRPRMQALFPDSRIEAERVLGFVKSHIAVR